MKHSKIMASFFSVMNKLQEAIFSAYLHRDYYRRPFFYEKKLHQARRELLSVMQQVRKNLDVAHVALFETLYEIFFSMNSFKLRIGDHVAFEVCELELKNMTRSLKKIFSDFQAMRAGNFYDLLGAVNQFEEVNRGAFQVVSHEPLVFWIFLQDLRSLCQCLEKIDKMVMHDALGK